LLNTLPSNRDLRPDLRLLEQGDPERWTLDRIVDSMSDGLLVLDDDRRFSYSNRRAAELLRVEPASLVGRRDTDVFAEVAHLYENPSAAWTDWEAALTQRDEHPCFDLRVAGDPWQDLRVQLFRVPGGPGRRDGTGLVIRDVSAERRLVRAKDELVAAVGHELASPATNLIASAEMLCSQVYSEPERRDMLETIAREGHRLTSIIRDFVDVQRVQQGRLEVHLRPVDVRALMRHVAAIARTDTVHRLVVEIAEHLPLVQADPERVQQVLANLVANAQKYTPQGRHIKLSARLLESSVEVAVADRGLGIPKDSLHRVFEKFYRVEAEDRRNIQGTGLGLAIVKDLVEAQGGEVGVSSDGPGKGARFWFRLPLAVASTTLEPTPSAAQHLDWPGSPLRVLSVDDDRAAGSALIRMLRPDGHHVVAVRSGEEALRRLADAPFDVVISDLGLGDGMDGWELARRVRAEWPHVRFVVASGSVGITQLDALQLGADAVLAKPYRPADLCRMLLSYAAPQWMKTAARDAAGQIPTA
jgi:signal transduction histidine kinase/ActR/RegA family two-component response regulator